MTRIMSFCLLFAAVVMAAEAVAQDLLPAPELAPPADQYLPTPGERQLTLPPAPSATAPPIGIPAGPAVGPPVVLYQNVRIKDPHKIHPLAVPTIVEVPDPNNRHCTVCIEICAPPCPCVRIKRHGLLGRKVEFDYGDFAVDVVSRHGLITIDYDA